jgi:hypothetical protein
MNNRGKTTGGDKEADQQAAVERIGKPIAIAIAFVSVFIFFIKLLFL